MKINELIKTFEIYTNNEEKQLLETLSGPFLYAGLTDREQIVIDNLCKKSLVSKFLYNQSIYVVKNETSG